MIVNYEIAVGSRLSCTEGDKNVIINGVFDFRLY